MDLSEHKHRPLWQWRFGLPVVLIVAANVLLGAFLLVHPSFLAIRLIYDLNTIAVPVCLLAVAAACIAAWVLRPSERHTLLYSLLGLVLAVALFGLRIYATHIEPYRLQLRTVTIQSPKIAKPLRILHISDLQANEVNKYYEQTFKAMSDLAPDLVLFTGDLIQTATAEAAASQLVKMTSLIKTLKPACGIYGVFGDVDWRLMPMFHDQPAVSETDLRLETPYSVSAIEPALRANKLGGMTILENRDLVLQTDMAALRILGLSNAASRNSHECPPLIESWFKTTAPSDFTIVLGHSPDYVATAKRLPIDLCLAGHTHGGQIRVPFIGPLITLSKLPRNLSRGFHKIGDTHLNVSAGIGCERADGIPPIRFNCPPEMTLITVAPANNAEDQSPMSASSHPEESEPSTASASDMVLRFFRGNMPSWWDFFRYGPAGIVWAAACLYAAGVFKRRFCARTGYSRKMFHFLIFGTVALLQATAGSRAVCLFGAATSAVVFFAVIKGQGNILYEAMAREQDAPHRTYFIIVPYMATFIGGITSNVMFGDFALAGYLVAGLGDAVGEPVGVRFGRHKYRVPSLGSVPAVRSYEGSAAVFIMSTVALCIAFAIIPHSMDIAHAVAVIPLIALLCAVLEAISPHGWDNATMQIVPPFLMKVLLS